MGARGRRRIVAIGVVLVSMALVGCESQSTVPPIGSGSPAARSSAGPTAGSSVKPIASQDPGQVALTRFFALATDDAFAYQATFTGESRHTVDILPISKGLLQVSGANVRVRATFTYGNGTKTTVEHRSVGGQGWIRYGSEAWERLTGFGPANSMAAFAAVHAPPDVTYLGPLKTGGTTAYQVSIASVIVNPIMIPASNLTDVAVTDSELTLLIDADGRPLSGTASITGRGRVSGQLQELVIDLKLTFVKVGQKVKISAP